MSETDDTDDLLLIPPDFFLVTSEPQPPYYNIVSSLIKQVGNLRDRIDTIESTSDISLVESYLDQSDSHIMFNPRKYSSSEEIHSTHSTPQKPRTKFKLNSLPASPNIDRFSPKKEPLKFQSPQRYGTTHISESLQRNPNEGVLNEVDSFISNVKTIKRNNAVRSLQNDFESVSSSEKDVKDILEEFKKQSQKIEAQGKEQDVKITKESTWKCGDNASTVPDYNLGARNTLYRTEEVTNRSGYQPVKNTELKSNNNLTHVQKYKPERLENRPHIYQAMANSEPPENKGSHHPTKPYKERYGHDSMYKPLSNTELNSYSSLDRFDSDSSSDSTQMTVFNKFPQNREELVRSPLHINALNALNMHKKTLDSTQQIKEIKIPKRKGVTTVSDNLGLLNLADIWGSGQQSPSKMAQKMEEEKIKRLHCEQLIHDLQNKNLELQQMLAVAVKVDQSKNKTINQFREALEKTSSTVEKLSMEKNMWDEEMAKIKSQHGTEMEKATQRANYYEKEMSKALNLAHGNQEKISSLEKKCFDLQKELRVIEENFNELRDSYQKEMDKNKQMSEIITQKEIEINQNKVMLNETKAEIASSKKAVESCQKEFSALKEECARLQNDLKHEHALTTSLTENKRKMEQEIQIYKSREKALNDLLNETKNKLESTKIELRNFYQGQLELIVESKRKEMQTQLDQERQKYEEEFKRKEMSMAKTAASHIKEISDKCALEIKLLEEKRQEEIRLYQLQVKQSKKEIEHMQQKLAQLPEKRAQIAKELQKVMESQWSEALRMIGNTPTSFTQSQNYPSKPQTLSRENTYTKMDQLVLRDQDCHSSINTRKTVKDDVTSDYDETPVSSRGGASKKSESEIQKYINMLLLRPPGNPTGAPPPNYSECPDSEQTQWHPGSQENHNNSQDSNKGLLNQRRAEKPPWK